MENLKITLIQPKIIWENIPANLEKYTRMIEETESTDLIVLPEMFTTGISMNAKELSEATDGATLQWMLSEAKKYQTAITGSVIIAENNAEIAFQTQTLHLPEIEQALAQEAR